LHQFTVGRGQSAFRIFLAGIETVHAAIGVNIAEWG
jgi:hypothetical protein